MCLRHCTPWFGKDWIPLLPPQPFLSPLDGCVWRGEEVQSSLGKNSFLSLSPHSWVITLSRGSQPLVLCTSCSRVFRFPVNPSTLPPVPGDILELPLAGSAPAPPATRESKRQKEEFLDREVFGSQAEMCKQSVSWFPEWWKRLW